MITLVRATPEDSEFLYSWANDPSVISGSFIRGVTITWDQHKRWFSEKLNDPLCFLYIVWDNAGNRVGQIRFDLVPEVLTEAYISIGIAPDFRQKGYAARSIQLGAERIFVDTNVLTIHAYIKQSNVASKSAFIRGGFTMVGLKKYKDVDAYYAYKSR